MQHIVLSRTDNLGDVLLTLPLAGLLKARYPQLRISFLGKAYTRPLIAACVHIDAFIDRADVMADISVLRQAGADAILHVFPDQDIARAAKHAGIPLRVGTSHRVFHWFTCNRLLHFGRKNSMLHEAQLNAKLLAGVGLTVEPTLEELARHTGFTRIPTLSTELQVLFQTAKKKIILHPKSKGSARDWPLAHYLQLAQMLDPTRYAVYVTGTTDEGKLIAAQCPTLLTLTNVTDLTGRLTLEELIASIAQADALVACSTGPLHIAAALGLVAIGIYPPIRPMHPGRWAPLGPRVQVLVQEKSCETCRKSGACACINNIMPHNVAERLNQALP